MNFEEPTFRPPTKSGYFRVGSVTPKRSRNALKPSVEKRKSSYKKGINSSDSRKRRSRMSHDLSRDKKKNAINQLRFGANKGTIPESKVGMKKRYTGSTKEKLIEFYKDHNPDKLRDVDKALSKYVGKEEQLFKNLAKRYNVDPSTFGVEYSSSTSVTNNAAGAFKTNASASETFRSLASPKRSGQFGPFGSFKQTAGDQKSKGRSTITSLKTYTEDLRVSSQTEDIMECD